MDRERKSALFKVLIIIELAFVILTGVFITNHHPFWMQTLSIWGILFLIVTLLVWSFAGRPSD